MSTASQLDNDAIEQERLFAALTLQRWWRNFCGGGGSAIPTLSSCFGSQVLKPIASFSNPNKPPVPRPQGAVSVGGFMADVAARVIQSTMRRGYEKKKALREVHHRRSEKQLATVESGKNPLQSSAHHDVLPATTSLVAPKEALPKQKAGDDLFVAAGGFQLNMAAFMIQGMWKRKVESAEARKVIDEVRRKQVDDELSASCDGKGDELTALQQEREFAARMLQRFLLQLVVGRKAAVQQGGKQHVQAPLTSLHPSQELDNERHYAAVKIQRFLSQRSRLGQLKVEHAQLQMLHRREVRLEDERLMHDQQDEQEKDYATRTIQQGIGRATTVNSTAGDDCAAPSPSSKPPLLPIASSQRVTTPQQHQSPVPTGRLASRDGTRPPSVLFQFRPKPNTVSDRDQGASSANNGLESADAPPPADVRRDGLSRVFQFAHSQELTNSNKYAHRGLRLMHDVLWSLIDDYSYLANGTSPLPSPLQSPKSVTPSADHRLEMDGRVVAEFKKYFVAVRWKSLHKPQRVQIMVPLSLAASPTPPQGNGSDALPVPSDVSYKGGVPHLGPEVSVAERIATEVLSIPEESSLAAHVEKYQRRHVADAKGLVQQRREFREERRQEDLRRSGGGGSGTLSSENGNALNLDDSQREVRSLYSEYDRAFEEYEEEAFLRHSSNAGGPAVTSGPRSAHANNSKLATTRRGQQDTDELTTAVEALYGDDWKYSTIVPRPHEDTDITADEVKRALHNLNRSSNGGKSNDIEKVVKFGLASLKALNERIHRRTEQLKSMKVGATDVNTRQRLEALQHSIAKANNTAKALQQQQQQVQRGGRNFPSAVTSTPSPSLPTKVGDGLLTSAAIAKIGCLPLPSLSPSRLRGVTGGAVSAPPDVYGPHPTASDEERPIRSESVIDGIPFRRKGQLEPLATDQVISPIRLGYDAKPSSRLPTNPSAAAADTAILERFLDEDDDAADEQRRAQWERKVLKEEYFQSICERHDRIEKLGGIHEDMLRRHPGWLVKGAKLLPLRLPKGTTSRSNGK